MTSMLSGIERTLFFSDVPDGTLKHKPAVRSGARDVGTAFGNLGSDIHNALFFDDLQSLANQSIAKQSVAAKQNNEPEEEKQSPDKAFVPLEELEEDEQPFPEEEDETSIQVACRGKTIPPPSLGRIQRYNERIAVSKKQKELLELAAGLEKQKMEMEQIMEKVKKAAV